MNPGSQQPADTNKITTNALIEVFFKFSQLFPTEIIRFLHKPPVDSLIQVKGYFEIAAKREVSKSTPC